MASENPTPTKKKRRARKGSDLHLRLPTDPRYERRYEPKATPGAAFAMLAMSIGAVLVGAGIYWQWVREWLRPEAAPHEWALKHLGSPAYLLAAGAVLLIAVALLGGRVTKPLRVGDAGVAVERDTAELERVAWFDVKRVLVDSSGVTVEASGMRFVVPARFHPEAAGRIAAEARARIPSRVEGDAALPAPDDDAGETLPLEAPQVAGRHCAESDQLIAFERDARLCGRCGEVYHRDGVPNDCVACGAKLVATAEPAGSPGKAASKPAPAG